MASLVVCRFSLFVTFLVSTLNLAMRAQVPQGSAFVSCCALVRNCQRCLFVVPRAGTFAGADLGRLEAEAAINPGAKAMLLQHLHVGFCLPLCRCSPDKQECCWTAGCFLLGRCTGMLLLKLHAGSTIPAQHTCMR